MPGSNLNKDESRLLAWFGLNPGPQQVKAMATIFDSRAKSYTIPPVRRARNALRRLVETGKVERIARGVYQSK